ncbi:ribosomal protein L11 methyltransferase [Halpernia humi]|uniref:Ribosomal protein L11 methyltransferase n=2 Tax=Halpernia humi TaxID=493375 RepID=A0A1H5SWV0_9FLAO|nr:ribosomal protein L11 methyltransferase [Halpernia humi]
MFKFYFPNNSFSSNFQDIKLDSNNALIVLNGKIFNISKPTLKNLIFAKIFTMQNYLEFSFKIKPLQPWSDILMAELIEIGFDSFTEEHDGILAYVQKDLFNEKELKNLDLLNNPDIEISYTSQEMPNINWNEEWEKNFSPINIEDKVSIRAEFHEPQNLPTEIIIQPKMSFGTGHHATTYLMIQQMLEMDFVGKSVLDMGCGTSVLAIFAKMKGAGDTLAIDIDEWSVENSSENAARNNVEFTVELGTAENLGKKKFDIILANINRNILISDIPVYVENLNENGQLLLSGLCFFDVDDILEVCKEQNLILDKKIQREEWVSLLLHK